LLRRRCVHVRSGRASLGGTSTCTHTAPDSD
jgi:hypothetical protein